MSESTHPGPLPVLVHPEWVEAFPFVVQGVTGRGDDREPFDLGLFGAGSAGRVVERWRRLTETLEMPRAVHGEQVHGTTVRVHDSGPPGLQVVFGTDGHATRVPGVLLTVATADCVAVTLLDPVRRVVGLLHAGWRGLAAGILEEGLNVLTERLGAGLEDLRVHAGPAICGACYEVGPEVHEALGLEPPDEPRPVDLRAVLARRAHAAGVVARNVTVSGHCTRCGDVRLFSHRGGCRERQVAFAALAS